MLLGQIVAIHQEERPIKTRHLALMTKQTTEIRPNTDLASQVDWARPGRHPCRQGCRQPCRHGQPRSTAQSTWVALAGVYPPRPIGPHFLIILFCLNFKFNSKLPKAISSSYGLRFSKTRTLFCVFFRDERNGVSRFPQFFDFRLIIF